MMHSLTHSCRIQHISCLTVSEVYTALIPVDKGSNFLFVSSNWSNVEERSIDTFPSLCVNEAGYGREKVRPWTCLPPSGPRAAVGAAQHHKQLNMLLLRVERPHSCWLEKLFFFFSYLSGLLLVTLQSNNLQVWAINTDTTASASISTDISGVPVHEQRSTEYRHQQKLTWASTHVHTLTDIYLFKLMHRTNHTHMCMHKHRRPHFSVRRKNRHKTICPYRETV